MGSAEEDEFHHRLSYTSTPPRNIADHPCVVPRKLRSAMIKRDYEVSTTSPTLPEAKKSSLRVKGIKLKKEVPKKRSRKQSTAMAAPITKEEEEVVETLNALAGIFSASSPPPPPLASSSSTTPHSIAIDTTMPIQFQCSANNNIINTTTITQEETIIQTDDHKGVLLQPLATTNDDNKKTLLLKRCATHVYVSHFIKVLQFVSEEEGKKGEESSRTFTSSQVSQKQMRQQFWTGEYEERKSTVDVLRWRIGGTEPDVSPPQMLCSRPPFHYGPLSVGCSKLNPIYDQNQDKAALAFLPDIPLSLQLLCGEPP